MTDEFAKAELFDLESRLEQVRRDLAGKAEANRTAEATADESAAQAAPPTGLSVGRRGVGTFEVSWNASSVRDLRYYELVVEETQALQNPRTIRTPETFRTLQGDADLPYFVKVRSVSQGGAVSAFTPRVNTSTAKADFQALEPGAAVRLYTDRQVAFTPSVLVVGGTTGPAGTLDTEEATYGACSTEGTTEGSVIVPFIIMRSHILTPAGGEIIIQVDSMRDGTALGDPFFFRALTVLDASKTIAGFSAPDEPGAGDHTYSVRVRVSIFLSPVNEDVALVVTPDLLSIQLVEFTQGID